MAVQQEVKSQLAKLLATEDIVVEHKQVETAQFNVHTRVLILPLWEKASNAVYDMLVGHEVGHALFTPNEDPPKHIPHRQSLNWFRPQIDFLRSDTHVWKFEDGFGENFVSWLSGIVGIDLEFTDDVEYAVAPDEGNKLEKTPQLIDTLIHFYKQDIEQFYPELAA